MKSMTEIRMLPRTQIIAEEPAGFKASVTLLSSTKSRPATVIGSWSCWWDHVSVSFPNRLPTWDEMAEIKRMFFKPDEVCVEFHPLEEEYVNLHRYCLHIWRPQREIIPTPPSWMVGPRKGETRMDAMRIAEAEYKKWEEAIRAQEA